MHACRMRIRARILRTARQQQERRGAKRHQLRFVRVDAGQVMDEAARVPHNAIEMGSAARAPPMMCGRWRLARRAVQHAAQRPARRINQTSTRRLREVSNSRRQAEMVVGCTAN